MDGPVLVVLGIIVFYVCYFIHLKRRAAVAQAREYVDVALPVARAVEAGVKASGSLLHRVARSGGRLEARSSRPQVIDLGGGAHEWRVAAKGGVLIFQVLPRDGGARVGGWADEVRIAQYGTSVTSGFFALGFALANALYRTIGLPRDPGGLIRRRKRVFRAVLAAQETAATGSGAA